jgi:hypothetical protein
MNIRTALSLHATADIFCSTGELVSDLSVFCVRYSSDSLKKFHVTVHLGLGMT